MIPVQHPTPVPPQLAAAFAADPAPADPTAAWGAFRGRAEVAIALDPEQRGLCVYCEETLLTHGSHIDHVVPKSVDHAGTFRFTNLVLSCTEASELGIIRYGSSCGHFRGNEYDHALFIKPTEPNCSDYFSCKINGELEPNPGLVTTKRRRAEYMIRELNLKCDRLNRRRRDWLAEILRNIFAMGHDPEAVQWYLHDSLQYGKPFVTIVQQYFGWI